MEGGTRATPGQIKQSKSRRGIRTAALPREQTSDVATSSAGGDSRNKETWGIPHTNEEQVFGREPEGLRGSGQKVCQPQSHEACVSVPVSETQREEAVFLSLEFNHSV